MKSSDEIISLSDPGDIGRAEQNRGDRFVVWVSNVFAWIFPALMIAICSQIVFRQAGSNQAWLDDLQWWLYGAAVLIGVGYAVTTNSHVRVDIFYDKFPDAKKTKIEIFALAWLFLPFIILSWDVTFGYAYSSVVANEGSDSPNGLHKLWLLKVFLNASFIFIGIAIWSAYVRYLARLTRPTLFKQLFWAFPSTMFLVNLVTYYALFAFYFATSAEDATWRDVLRLPVFGEVEIGPWEIKVTILITLALTILLLILAKLLERRGSNEG